MDSTVDFQATDEQKGNIKEIEDTQDRELVQAGKLSIESHEDLEGAREFVKHLKMRKKKIEGTLGEVRKANHAAWQKAQKLEKSFVDPIDNAINDIKVKANTFLNVEEEKRLAEEARLRKEAEKEAERRQKALSKKIDKLFDGVKGDTEQLKALEDMLVTTAPDSPEAIMLENKIDILKRKIEGAITKAEAHKEASEPAPSFVQPSVAPAEKTKGVSSKMKRVGTVVNILELVRAVGSGLILPDVFEVKQAKINKLVDSGMASIPGVEITEERATSFR